jgi:hypothetical protein
MNTQNNQTIYNFSNSFCELQGIAKCFQAYADNFAGEEVQDGGIGFNSNSGYTYIALENGITICSMLGREVEYLITNFEDGEETFFDTPEQAEEFLTTLND